mgnify:CR=1 FL=1
MFFDKKKQKSDKKNDSTEAQYFDRFLSRNRIEAPRKGIFVNRELVHRIAKYAGIMGQGQASIGAYVEEIILDHFERNAATIESLFNASPVRRL